MIPIISVIIPCFNSETTLESTLESVLNQEFQHWEAIIVNDGSTDTTEEIGLRWVKKDKRFKYFAKQNEGLGKTRNYGIAKSNGIYILPLDSDNQLIKDFVSSAIPIFEKDSNIGVVHGNAEYFGEKSGLWIMDSYNLEKILVENYIDACTIYKKKMWEQVGGYDENMPFQGHEDWDFWIALGILNVRFYHLEKTTFKYFVSKKSMIRNFTDKMHEANNNYIFIKYSREYQIKFKTLYYVNQLDKKESLEILKSKKFVIDLFFSTFFRFSVFGYFKVKK